MTQKWKEQFRKKMEGYSEPAPELEWASLEKALPAQPERKRIPAFVYYSAAAAAALLLAAGIYLGTSDKKPSKEDIVVENAAKEETPSLPSSTDMTDSVPEEVTDNAPESTPAVSTRRSGRKAKDTVTSTEELIADASLPVEENAAPSEEFPTERRQQEYTPSDDATALAEGEGSKDEKTHEEDSPKGDSTPYIRQADPFSLVDEPKRGRRKLTAMAFVSDSPGSFGKIGTFDTALLMADTYSEPSVIGKGNNSGYVNSIDLNTDVEHDQPIRAGLRLRYGIGENWGVESGLTYTYLSSEIDNSGWGVMSTTDQRLSYIGIPIVLTRNLWSSGRWGVYASAGGMVEKMVKGRRYTSSTVNGSSDASTTDKVTIKPLQFSVMGSAGIEYTVWKGFGLYLEPSLDYHFDNGSPVPTIYADKPLRFTLSLGLRYSIGN